MDLKRSGRLGTFWIFFFFLVVITKASNGSHTTDFQISSEPAPSLILQQVPRLFTALDNSFVMIWEDYRLGERSHFAQRFDSSGMPIGANFPVIGNEEMAFLPDGSAMIIGLFDEEGMPLLEEAKLNVKGQILPPFGTPQKPFLIDGGIYSECGTGFWGLDVKLVATKSSFLFGFNFGGVLSIKRFAPDGTVAFDSDDKLSLPQTVATFSLAVNNHDDYVLLWFNADPYSTGLPSGIFATFFNQKDSIINDNCLIQQYDQRYRLQNEAPKLRAISVSDTLFQFFWADADSLTLNYVVYNASGQMITSVTSLDLPFSLFGYGREIYNFAFTNMRYGVFGLLMTVAQFLEIPTMPDPQYYETQIYWFDKNGNLLTSSQLDSSAFSALGDNLAQLAPNFIACPLEISHDVFLCKRNDLAWLDSLQVNDDMQGSNQIVPRAVIRDSNSFYVSWQNEKGFFGRAIDLGGNYLNGEQSLEGEKILFLVNGTAINFWKKYDYQGEAETGMTLYDTRTWNVIKRETFYVGWSQAHGGSAIPTSDSTFIVLTNKRSGLSLVSYSSKGQILAEKNIAIQLFSNFDLLQNDSDSFWVLWGGKAQLFSNQLQPLSSIFVLGLSPPPILHFGRGRFLKIHLSGNPPGYFATVVDTTGARCYQFQLTEDFHAKNFSLTLLDSTKFLALWTINRQIYARTFSFDGQPVTDLLSIHADIDAYRDWGNACVNNDKALFVWADTRNYGQGYDIYGSIHDLIKITPVIHTDDQINTLAGSYLERIYPNPFNTSTTIKFFIINKAMIHLEIFNIIGKKVKTLYVGLKPAGHFEVQWDGKDEMNQDVASGIYFCRLQAAAKPSSEAVMQVRKIILLR